jgi:hypothetical protein
MNLQARTRAAHQPRRCPAPGPGPSAALWPSAGAASLAGYLLHGPVAAALALAALVAALGAVALLRPVLLGDSDPRSPFVRFMLLVCVLLGRPPGDYLPPEDPEHPER